MFVDFPELIMVDTTFKLLDLRFPGYLLLGIDGNGLKYCFFVLSEETKVWIEMAVKLFQKQNPSFFKTKVSCPISTLVKEMLSLNYFQTHLF